MVAAVWREFIDLLKLRAPEQRDALSRNAPPMRRRIGDKPLTQACVRQWYQRPASFTDRLPWMDYNDTTGVFELIDGRSVGALFEVTPVGCEARSSEHLEALHTIIYNALSHALPEAEPPWIVQLYASPEPVADGLMQTLRDYIDPALLATDFTQRYLTLLEQHLRRVERPQGYFVDELLTQLPWRARQVRVRMVLYREVAHAREARTADDALNIAAERFSQALATAGITCRRGTRSDLTDWLIPWFNPCPALPDGTPGALREALAHASSPPGPYANDIAETLLLGWPRSDVDTGTFWFDGRPHSIVTVHRLLAAPAIGHFTAERTSAGGRTLAFFDRIPEGTSLAMTIVAEAKDKTEERLNRLYKRAIGDATEAGDARNEVDNAREGLARGNRLFPVNMAFYLSAADLTELRQHENALNALLLAERLSPVTHEFDPVRLDAYLRNLPMNYTPAFDAHTRWSKLTYADATAALMPVYGRSRGSGRPGILMWNRGGEPFLWDPLHPKERKKNAHTFVVGPTGAGKSSTLNTMLRHQLAVHRPRLFIFDPVGGFELFADDMERAGLRVHRVKITRNENVSLPPFAGAFAVLDERTAYAERARLKADDTDEHWRASDGLDGHNDAADPLAEMELKARLMCTGGDPHEEARMTRADQRLLQRAIIAAAETTREGGRTQVITADVVRTLRTLTGLSPGRAERAHELADGMEIYTEGFAGEVFNRVGDPWPEADITVLNAGAWAKEGHADKLALAVISFIDHVNAQAEHHRYDDRHTIFVLDECHLVTKHPLLCPYLVLASKVWGRRLAVWLWLATQNMKDMPDDAERILNMLEWWMCLSMPKKEINQLARFRAFSEDERHLLEAAKKDPGKYVEGVLFSDTITALFRNVPPRIDIATAQTENEERAERHRVWQTLGEGATELDAAYEIARRMEATLDATP